MYKASAEAKPAWTIPSSRQTSVENERLCLEGTTERSDSNRVRSARISANCTMCLEGTTPQDMQFVHRKRRTAFQAELLQQFLPRTSSPALLSLRSVVPSRHLTHNSTKPSIKCNVFLETHQPFTARLAQTFFNYNPFAGQFVSSSNKIPSTRLFFPFPPDISTFLLDIFSFHIRKSLLQSL